MKKKIIDYLVISIRLLLGALFINTGSMKFLGVKEDLDSPDFLEAGPAIIEFFRFMENTGEYWQFIGMGQLITGLLLFTQRFATLGAIIMMPISLNILMVQLTFNELVGYKILDICILLINILLLVYDREKLKYIFKTRKQLGLINLGKSR